KHAVEQPAALSELRPDLPAGLEAVVARMMAKAPGQRYQTPGEVAAALEPFTRPRPADSSDMVALLLGPVESLRRPRRRVLVATLAALLFLGMTIAGVVYRIQTDKGELVITTESDDAEGVIKQGGKVVRILDTKTDKEITLALRSGVYELELKGAPEGLKLNIDKATLTRGETVLARITRGDKPGDALTEPPPAKRPPDGVV